jgi:ABC-type multidrug transport system permease subunit
MNHLGTVWPDNKGYLKHDLCLSLLVQMYSEAVRLFIITGVIVQIFIYACTLRPHSSLIIFYVWKLIFTLPIYSMTSFVLQTKGYIKTEGGNTPWTCGMGQKAWERKFMQ